MPFEPSCSKPDVHYPWKPCASKLPCRHHSEQKHPIMGEAVSKTNDVVLGIGAGLLIAGLVVLGYADATLLEPTIRDLKRGEKPKKLSKKVVYTYQWCATFDDKVQHAHYSAVLCGERVCTKGMQVMDTAYWQKNQPQPEARCKKCESIIRRRNKAKKK